MFRILKRYHQAKILVIKHKKDSESLFHRFEISVLQIWLHVAIQYGLKIKLALKE
jgi:hypothetical protein